jgi:hypothetical protein
LALTSEFQPGLNQTDQSCRKRTVDWSAEGE